MEGSRMGFKIKQRNLTFSDLENKTAVKNNRSKDMLIDLEQAIEWDSIEQILLEDYPVGQSKEGNKAYPPLFLFKCLLLQKWFRIPSDPELENQINDRISFKKFLGLPLDKPSPDHSTFSRFRSRL